jgi:hypothetical protein
MKTTVSCARSGSPRFSFSSRPSWIAGLALALALGGIARAGLVDNGDFTEEFADWTLSGNITATNTYAWFNGLGTIVGAPDAPDVAYIGPDAPGLELSQTITTIPDQLYTFSFELAHTAYDGDVGAEFTASFGSDEVLDLVGGPQGSDPEAAIYGQWQTESFLVEATAPETTISFTFISPPGYYVLTDVDPDPYVPPPPPPPPPGPSGGVPDGGVGLGMAAMVLFGLLIGPRFGLRRA